MISFTKEAWEHYLYWQNTDSGKLNRINNLIKECLRNPFKGTGKPEPLRGELSGLWSRRIDHVHRFVYKYEQSTLYIFSCRFHY
ncbi:MAG: Txe/YoeB family addiction module toxin [Candidatus Eremiobacterota bacterium]